MTHELEKSVARRIFRVPLFSLRTSSDVADSSRASRQLRSRFETISRSILMEMEEKKNQL